MNNIPYHRERGIVRKSWFLVGGWLIALLLFVPHVGLTQQASDDLNKLRFELLQRDMESLKAGQKALSNDLQEIKKLLSSRGDDRSPVRDINTILNVGEAFSKGDKQARLTLVEFTDYQ